MVENYTYLGSTIHFYNNLVSAYDLLVAFSVPDPASEFYKIQNHPLSSDLFRIPKRVRWQSEDGEMNERIFLNGQQIFICLEYLQQRDLIKNDEMMNFIRWYQSIVDRGIEIWMIDRQEEKIQDQLILLAGYGKIKLQQEVTVLTRPGTQEKTRRYDIVEFINSGNTVKIRELKSHKITQQDIEKTLNTKDYLQLAQNRWPDKKIELIFSSLDGIDEQAELMIDTIPDISYEDVREFALRLYINALENTPREGWTFFKSDVVSKFSQILPDQKLLRAAEQEIIAKPEPEQPEATVNRQPQPTQTYSIPQQPPQYLETENHRKDKPVVNPSLTQTPRYQIADVIPLQYETSILDWLERSGRLIDRTSETDESLLDSEEEIAELIENDGKYDDDDDDDILVDDD